MEKRGPRTNDFRGAGGKQRTEACTIQDHMAFKKLLAEGNPTAVEVWAEFSSSKDQTSFDRGVLKTLGKSPVEPVVSPETGSTSSVSPRVCIYFKRNGKCKNGDNCPFLHDVVDALEKRKNKKDFQADDRSVTSNNSNNDVQNRNKSTKDVSGLLGVLKIHPKASPQRVPEPLENLNQESKAKGSGLLSFIKKDTSALASTNNTASAAAENRKDDKTTDSAAETLTKEDDTKTSENPETATMVTENRNNTDIPTETTNILIANDQPVDQKFEFSPEKSQDFPPKVDFSEKKVDLEGESLLASLLSASTEFENNNGFSNNNSNNITNSKDDPLHFLNNFAANNSSNNSSNNSGNHNYYDDAFSRMLFMQQQQQPQAPLPALVGYDLEFYVPPSISSDPFGMQQIAQQSAQLGNAQFNIHNNNNSSNNNNNNNNRVHEIEHVNYNNSTGGYVFNPPGVTTSSRISHLYSQQAPPALHSRSNNNKTNTLENIVGQASDNHNNQHNINNSSNSNSNSGLNIVPLPAALSDQKSKHMTNLLKTRIGTATHINKILSPSNSNNNSTSNNNNSNTATNTTSATIGGGTIPGKGRNIALKAMLGVAPRDKQNNSNDVPVSPVILPPNATAGIVSHAAPGLIMSPPPGMGAMPPPGIRINNAVSSNNNSNVNNSSNNNSNLSDASLLGLSDHNNNNSSSNNGNNTANNSYNNNNSNNSVGYSMIPTLNPAIVNNVMLQHTPTKMNNINNINNINNSFDFNNNINSNNNTLDSIINNTNNSNFIGNISNNNNNNSSNGNSLFDTPTSTPFKTNVNTNNTNTKNTNNNTNTVNATPLKKVVHYRNTKNQVGSLILTARNFNSNDEVTLFPGFHMRPSSNMNVTWILPEHVFNSGSTSNSNSRDTNNTTGIANKDNRTDLVIGLVRYGSYTNSPCIVAKQIDLKSKSVIKLIDNQTNTLYYKGKISFHTPKAAGMFVYRIFDQSNKEVIYNTITTSSMFYVDIFEYDIITNINFLLSGITNKNDKSQQNAYISSVIKTISQFPTVIKSMKVDKQMLFNMNNNTNNPNNKAVTRMLRDISDSLVDILHVILTAIEQHSDTLDIGFEKKQHSKINKQLQKLNNINNSNNNNNSNINDVDSVHSGNRSAAVSFDESHLSNLISNLTVGNVNALGVPRKDRSMSLVSTQSNTEEDEAFWVAYKQAFKIHIEAHEVVETMISSVHLWPLLPSGMQEYLQRMHNSFCPLLQRFFPSAAKMQQCRFEEFGFRIPVLLDSKVRVFEAPLGAALTSVNDIYKLNHHIQELLPQLLPTAQFYEKREQIRSNLQEKLVKACSDILPADTQIVLYGSSCNNFGSEHSDLDMCLLLPAIHSKLSSEDKVRIIERLGEALNEMGMSEVHTRSTARIPIVQFKDLNYGVECDIAIANPLAISNTKLLLTYSKIDSRVRELAFLIKKWAKSRHLNSPGDGTLSSYGFILLMIHFLQTRPVPLIPNLQKLPPSWNGSPFYLPHKQDTVSVSRHAALCSRLEINSTDNSECNTYFYEMTRENEHLLKSFAAENKESTAELLIEFFKYFTWKFDSRKQIISVRNGGDPELPTKIDKAESDAWMTHDRLSIEDPFETWYDVAHVIKAPQMTYIRNEFMRAYTLASRITDITEPVHNTALYIGDSLPITIAPADFIAKLCESSEIPVFSTILKEKVEKVERKLEEF